MLTSLTLFQYRFWMNVLFLNHEIANKVQSTIINIFKHITSYATLDARRIRQLHSVMTIVTALSFTMAPHILIGEVMWTKFMFNLV